MAQPGSMPLDPPRIYDKDSSNQLADSAEAPQRWSDPAGANILRWEDDGGRTIECRDRADRLLSEPATRNNQPSAPPAPTELG